MIDLHCHILPSIDDGAQNLSESLALVEAAIDNGITHMVCTPHIQLGRFDNTIQSIASAFNELQQQVTLRGLAIKLAYAAEVRICPEIMVMAKQGKLPFIGKWQENDVLLLELPHSHVPAGTEQLISWLLKNNIMPMIAHPERNRDILADFTKFHNLARTHCLFQITAASICGHFGEGPFQLAAKLLLENKVTVIATDTHSVKRRPPCLAEGKMAASQIIGIENAQQLVVDIPKLISQSKFDIVS